MDEEVEKLRKILDPLWGSEVRDLHERLFKRVAREVLEAVLNIAKRQGWSVVETRDESDEEFIRFVAIIVKGNKRARLIVDEENYFWPDVYDL